ncbi:MAG: phosphoribosylanthranilate isomerase [Gammaproteobacteria bacterium]
MRVRTKICGITRQQDALDAVEAGADALGFVFWSRSARCVTPSQAAGIIARLPAFVTPVALFVDPSREEVEAALAGGCTLLQFHGDEPPSFCASFGAAWIKAVRVTAQTDLPAVARRYEGARGLLLDTYVEGQPGGTGQSFDWSLAARDIGMPVILAGGLTPDNVGEAVRMARPYAVDVSGGVEISKGIKDRARMAAFIEGVRRVSEED